MKEFTFSFKEALVKGMTPLLVTPRNAPYLLDSVGMFPEDGTLRSDEDMTQVDLSSLGLEFPYPQVFELSIGTVVCGPTQLWILINGVLTSLISGLTEGTLWSLADFGTFILMTNGATFVAKHPGLTAFELHEDPDIYSCGSICAVGSQIVVGAPNVGPDLYWQFTRQAVLARFLHRLIHQWLPGQYVW